MATQLSKYFTLEECTHSDTAVRKGIPNVPSPEGIAMGGRLCTSVMDTVREKWGALSVTSGFRSHELNLDPDVNGSATSDHVWSDGAASIDFIPLKAEMQEVFEWICGSGLVFDQCFLEYKLKDGIRHYRCIHISLRDINPRRQAGIKPTGGYGKIEWCEVTP